MSGHRLLGLATDPFDLSSNEQAMFYRTLGHQDCLERLQRAIGHQSGLVLVAGDTGFGKSTIRHALLHELQGDNRTTIGTIDDPRACRTDVQFLRAILAQFALPEGGRSAFDLISTLRRFIGDRETADGSVLLVLDDGHYLTSAQLEILRTLLSFDPDPDSGKRVTVVIFARPELEEKIRRKRNLARRLNLVHNLNPLNRSDTAALIRHRLTAAGHPDDAPCPFHEDAIEAIYERTAGIPRAIIAAGNACLEEAHALGLTTIDGVVAARVSAIAVAQGARPIRGVNRPQRANGRQAPTDRPFQTRIPLLIRSEQHIHPGVHGGEQ
jgi:type II secretory pathway predicted ATPase ExeA